jgi:hypothetical protein
VLIRWPAWWRPEPERTNHQRYLIGLHQADGSVMILLQMDDPDPAKAMQIMADPERVRALLRAECNLVQRDNVEPPEFSDEPDPLVAQLLAEYREKVANVAQKRETARRQAAGLFEGKSNGTD